MGVASTVAPPTSGGHSKVAGDTAVGREGVASATDMTGVGGGGGKVGFTEAEKLHLHGDDHMNIM